MSLTVTQGRGVVSWNKLYLHSTGEERGLESHKTHPQGESGPLAELVQARLGRGHREVPLGCETNVGGTGWLDTCDAPPGPSPRAFLLCGSQLLVGHPQDQAPYGAMVLACAVGHTGLLDPQFSLLLLN